jgi:hypothetical protein
MTNTSRQIPTGMTGFHTCGKTLIAPSGLQDVMRISTMLEWSAIAGVFIVAIVIMQALAGMTSPGVPALALTGGGGSSASSPVCSGTDLGGFYQDDLTAPQPITRQVDDVTFTLQPLYRYRIVGKIVGKDKYSATPLDRLGPMDLTIANGDLIRPEILSHFTVQKYPRHFRYLSFFPAGTKPPSQLYTTEHISNNHLIFADDTVYSVAGTAGVGDLVEISGYLVTVSGTSPTGWTYTWGTSTTRSDLGEKSCELVYVETFRKYTC